MWLPFALLSGVLFSINGLVTRHLLRQNKDAWAFSFYYSAIGALVSLPLMLINPKSPTQSYLWIILLVAGLLIVGHNFVFFRSVNYLAPSIQGALIKFRLVWGFLIGLLLLHEPFSWMKLMGTALTISAGLLIIKKFHKPQSLRGIIYALIGTLIYASVLLIYKILFQGFNSATLTFFIFLIPAILNLCIMPQAFPRIFRIIKQDFKSVTTACVLGGLANLTMNQALAIGEVSKVPVIIESFVIVTLVGEYFVLKEKDHALLKIMAVIMATGAAVLIHLS